MIVFLDFDGVTHPFFPRADLTDAENATFSNLPAIEEALRAHPHVRVVISSSWRLRKPWPELLALFSDDIRPRVIGMTPTSAGNTGNDPGARMNECLAWLDDNGHTHTPWLALDDFDGLFSPGGALLLCHDGFRERERALFDEAMRDLDAFKVKYPIKDPMGSRLHPDGGLLFLPPGVSLKK